VRAASVAALVRVTGIPVGVLIGMTAAVPVATTPAASITVAAAMAAAVAATASISAGWPVLEVFVLLLDVGDEILTQLLGLRHHDGIGSATTC
jgi:hypothetical protein